MTEAEKILEAEQFYCNYEFEDTQMVAVETMTEAQLVELMLAFAKEKKMPSDKDLAVEIVATFLHNPHPNQKNKYNREKKAFANGWYAFKKQLLKK